MTSEVTTVSFVHWEHDEKSMLVTAEVLKKFGPNSRLVNEGQFWNIKSIMVTALVSKLDKSREVRDAHEPNMTLMLVTEVVSKLDTSI